jgi:NAD+ diphosphatase
MNFVQKNEAPQKLKGKAFWLCFKNDKLLVYEIENKINIPYLANLDQRHIMPVRYQYLGLLDGKNCFSAQLADDFIPKPGLKLLSLRELYFLGDESLFSLARRAFLIVEWDKNHQYCGRCGTATQDLPKERAKLCPDCALVSYPRIAPAVIVAVIKGNTILLAHGKRFKNRVYSVLAGFVESGESLEECINREVYEEAGIRVKKIKYFNSQSWPFPNSLMIAFTACYASGKIKVDQEEIEHAAWFKADELPELPPPISIARRLIDWFVNQHNS